MILGFRNGKYDLLFMVSQSAMSFQEQLKIICTDLIIHVPGETYKITNGLF